MDRSRNAKKLLVSQDYLCKEQIEEYLEVFWELFDVAALFICCNL